VGRAHFGGFGEKNEDEEDKNVRVFMLRRASFSRFSSPTGRNQKLKLWQKSLQKVKSIR